MVEKMKTIYYKDFDKRGILIDVEDEYVYQMGHLREAINIPYEKLLYNNTQLYIVYFSIFCWNNIPTKNLKHQF